MGNSLLPVLNNGDLVAVDISQTVPIRDGDLYAVRDGVLLRVKILINLPDGGLILRSFNKDEYPDEILTFEDRRARIHVIGRYSGHRELGNASKSISSEIILSFAPLSSL